MKKTKPVSGERYNFRGVLRDEDGTPMRRSAREDVLDNDAHACKGVLSPDGHGSFCEICGETVS